MKRQTILVPVRQPVLIPGKKMYVGKGLEGKFVPMRVQEHTQINKGRGKEYYEERKKKNAERELVEEGSS